MLWSRGREKVRQLSSDGLFLACPLPSTCKGHTGNTMAAAGNFKSPNATFLDHHIVQDASLWPSAASSIVDDLRAVIEAIDTTVRIAVCIFRHRPGLYTDSGPVRARGCP